MNYRVELTPSAESDIDEAYLWWAKHRSVEQAVRWYRELRMAIGSLSTMPQRYALCREPDLIAEELREMLFGLSGGVTHRVVFEIASQNVRILRVRHVARDV